MSAPFCTTVVFFCVFLSSRLQLKEAFYPVISILLVQAHYLCILLVKSLNDA